METVFSTKSFVFFLSKTCWVQWIQCGNLSFDCPALFLEFYWLLIVFSLWKINSKSCFIRSWSKGLHGNGSDIMRLDQVRDGEYYIDPLNSQRTRNQRTHTHTHSRSHRHESRWTYNTILLLLLLSGWLFCLYHKSRFQMSWKLDKTMKSFRDMISVIKYIYL